ncbi:MAG: acetate/propionate family kinase [Pseudomonadota bacterium]
MSGLILTLNAGSSSLKFALYEPRAGGEPELILAGQAERLGGEARFIARYPAGDTVADHPFGAGTPANHHGALAEILRVVESERPGAEMAAVGHRVVHGAHLYGEPVEVTDAIIASLREFEPFAPLHQPHNIAGILAAKAAFPGAIEIACFDTAFHRAHPFVNDVFALPRRYYDKGVRRYGFHGLSYTFIADHLSKTMPDLHAGKVVVAHLGNGASMCAIKGGQSIGSSMGFSAMDGLPMGTRCGQLDPGVVLYLMEHEGLTTKEVTDVLYRQSGLLGLSGLSNDMRTLQEAGTQAAKEAIDYFVFRIRRELGAMAAVLSGLDGLVFTGGIGEHDADIRARVCADGGWLGLAVDEAANARGERVISTADSAVTVMAIPTDEERVIARAAQGFLQSAGLSAA